MPEMLVVKRYDYTEWNIKREEKAGVKSERMSGKW